MRFAGIIIGIIGYLAIGFMVASGVNKREHKPMTRLQTSLVLLFWLPTVAFACIVFAFDFLEWIGSLAGGKE